jgi:hypothetical protein
MPCIVAHQSRGFLVNTLTAIGGRRMSPLQQGHLIAMKTPLDYEKDLNKVSGIS